MNQIDRLNFENEGVRASIEDDARDLLRLALAVQGPEALTCDRRHAAYHEAGHAVAYYHEGQRIQAVRVFQRGGFWLGFTRAGTRWRIGPETDPRADLRDARTLLAGPLSELIFTQRPALGAGVDELALARSIVGNAAHKLDCDPERLMSAVTLEVLLMLREHRDAIEEIARRLMRKPKLDGSIVAAILRAGPSPDSPLRTARPRDFSSGSVASILNGSPA
jgi:ATP-dependent Zn protease